MLDRRTAYEAAEEWAQPEPDMNRLRTLDEKYELHGVDATYGTDKI